MKLKIIIILLFCLVGCNDTSVEELQENVVETIFESENVTITFDGENLNTDAEIYLKPDNDLSSLSQDEASHLAIIQDEYRDEYYVDFNGDTANFYFIPINENSEKIKELIGDLRNNQKDSEENWEKFTDQYNTYVELFNDFEFFEIREFKYNLINPTNHNRIIYSYSLSGVEYDFSKLIPESSLAGEGIILGEEHDYAELLRISDLKKEELKNLENKENYERAIESISLAESTKSVEDIEAASLSFSKISILSDEYGILKPRMQALNDIKIYSIHGDDINEAKKSLEKAKETNSIVYMDEASKKITMLPDNFSKKDLLWEELQQLKVQKVLERKEIEDNFTFEQKNALDTAQSYISSSGFSRKSLIKQLEFKGYTTQDSQLIVDYIDLDWKEQAIRVAQNYLDNKSFSRQRLYNQLIYKGFNDEDANYALDQLGY